jgi:hypothetical protein
VMAAARARPAAITVRRSIPASVVRSTTSLGPGAAELQ